MVAADIYEIVEEHFAEPASPDLVLKVRNGSSETAFDFAGRYQEWVAALKPRIAEKHARQLRPYIAGSYRGPKGVALFAPVFSKDENHLWALYDGLVHHLLYCHSVAIENPLMHLVTGPRIASREMPLLSLRNGMLGFKINPTVILSRYIAMLVELRDLVDCGAVVMVEAGPSSMSGYGYAPHVRVYREADSSGAGTYQSRSEPYALSDAQFAQIQQRVGAPLAKWAEADLAGQYAEEDITDFMRQDRQRTLLEITLGEIASTARVSDHVGDLDFYLCDHFQENAFAEALAVAPGWLAGSSPSPSLQRQMTLLDRLLQLNLPDLSNLAPGDIRAIRRSDETFNRWRQALGNGLGVLEAQPDAPLTAEQLKTVHDEIYENIVEAGLAIDTSISTSDVLGAGKAGVLKLLVGLLLSGLSGGAAAPAVAARAGLASGQKLGMTALGKWQQKPVAESIDRHTVLFAPLGS